MSRMVDKIMKRVSAHGNGKWVCTPKDFLDLGSREAVDQALCRLVKAGSAASGWSWPVRHAEGQRGAEAPRSGQSGCRHRSVARRDGVPHHAGRSGGCEPAWSHQRSSCQGEAT